MSLTANSSLESAREKILHELDVHYVQKEGIKRSWAQDSKMSSGGRNDSNSYQLARIGEKKIFHESTYIMSRKQESNVFALIRPK